MPISSNNAGIVRVDGKRYFFLQASSLGNGAYEISIRGKTMRIKEDQIERFPTTGNSGMFSTASNNNNDLMPKNTTKS